MGFSKSMLVSAFSILLIASCSKAPEQYIDGNDLIPSEPPFWEYFTIEGVDSDNDGIRDDVELWINKEFDDVNLRRALKWETKTITDFYKAKNTQSALMNLEHQNKASICVSFFSQYRVVDNDFTFLEKVSLLQGKILNNWWRKKKYNQVGRLIPSGIYSAGSMRLYDQYRACDFPIENLDSILKAYLEANKFSKRDKESFSELIKELQ